MWGAVVVWAGLAVLAAAPVRAAEVLVAVAANFAAPMARIASDFSAATGHTVKMASGATGKFHAQITSGAPFQVLLAGDDETPRKLLAAGHGVAGSATTYAIGRLVLWSARPGLVDAHGAVLAGTAWRHLAIASPRVAPYGAAAMQVLRARGLEDAVASRLVAGESVAQAHQFVATGNADLGFVALSQVQAPGKPVIGSMWRVPAELHTPIRQDALLLKAGEQNPAALALMAYLKSAPARAVIQTYGYGF